MGAAARAGQMALVPGIYLILNLCCLQVGTGTRYSYTGTGTCIE